MYKGLWLNDYQKGQGEDTKANGDIFRGNFVDGKANGYGEFFWTNGDIFKGYWSNQ